MENRDWFHYLCSLISTAQERFCSGQQNTVLPAKSFTALPGDDAAEAPADSLTKFLGKEKIEYVERAYWKEDRHDPDLR